MKMTKTNIMPGILTALAALNLCASTTQISLPDGDANIDTERSQTLPLSGFNELTRFFDMTFEMATPDGTTTMTNACCIQCAFGIDRNADSDLAPEETDLVVGYDCGAWFVRDVDAAPSPRQTEVENSLIQRDEGVASTGRDEGVASTTITFDLYPVFNRAWNAVKVTTRGRVIPDVSIAARFRTGVTVIVIR